MSSLATIIDATASAVADNPANAAATFRARGEGVGPVATTLRIGRHVVQVDEPASLGGEDAAPNPVETALAGLVSCQVVTYRFWAAKLGIDLDTIDVSVEGDIDVRGFFGLDEAVRPGLGEVRVKVTLGGPESGERYEELARQVDEHCPVLDLFTNQTTVKTEVVTS